MEIEFANSHRGHAILCAVPEDLDVMEFTDHAARVFEEAEYLEMKESVEERYEDLKDQLELLFEMFNLGSINGHIQQSKYLEKYVMRVNSPDAELETFVFQQEQDEHHQGEDEWEEEEQQKEEQQQQRPYRKKRIRDDYDYEDDKQVVVRKERGSTTTIILDEDDGEVETTHSRPKNYDEKSNWKYASTNYSSYTLMKLNPAGVVGDIGISSGGFVNSIFGGLKKRLKFW